ALDRIWYDTPTLLRGEPPQGGPVPVPGEAMPTSRRPSGVFPHPALDGAPDVLPVEVPEHLGHGLHLGVVEVGQAEEDVADVGGLELPLGEGEHPWQAEVPAP